MGSSRRKLIIGGAAALGIAGVAACGTDGPSVEPSAVDKVEPSAVAKADAKALAKAADIPVGGGKIMADKGVVVTQPKAGEFKCFSNICTHQQCPLTSVTNGKIMCSCHMSEFSIADGSVLSPPATTALAAKEITVQNGEIKLA